jgi:ribosomal protein S18 acetylase RimI-like enzyme
MNTQKEINMKIENCTMADADTILSLYESARQLQTQKGMVVWPLFERDLVEKEIKEQRQLKLIIDNRIACNWAVTFSDKGIWGVKDMNDAIYIHRIATNPVFRGNRYVDAIVTWAKVYATQMNKQFVRLDTLGNNTKLIDHYTSAGFQFLGIFMLTNTAGLPGHYQKEPNCCLFEIDLYKVK